MARPAKITPQTFAPLIAARGPVSATDLAATFGVNRTTVVRNLAKMGEDLVILGATRNRRYALHRQVLTAGSVWPIYAIDETGRSQLWARLEALHDRLWRIVWAETAPSWADRFSSKSGLWDGFPFFLADIRPQGFLGRAVAFAMSGLLAVPDDPRKWSDDNSLLFLQTAGEDLPGALVVGDDCLRRSQLRILSPEANQGISENERAEHYSQMAKTAWSMAAEKLLRDGLIDGETSALMVKLHAFRELIGNSDMHAGTLAFWLDESLPFRLAPVYDMLPMLWANRKLLIGNFFQPLHCLRLVSNGSKPTLLSKFLFPTSLCCGIRNPSYFGRSISAVTKMEFHDPVFKLFHSGP